MQLALFPADFESENLVQSQGKNRSQSQADLGLTSRCAVPGSGPFSLNPISSFVRQIDHRSEFADMYETLSGLGQL